jgi:CBS domain-containing protein
MMRASEVMTRRVVSVSPEATILEAIKLMLKHHISGLPVIDGNGVLVDIVTESDFLHRPEIGTERKRSRWLDAFFGPEAAARDYVRSYSLQVGNVMTRDPFTVTENAPLDEVVRIMESRKVKRLPVMRRSKLVGIISRADLMLAVASIDRTGPFSGSDDASIRNRIMTAVREQSWAEGAFINIIVSNGAADIWGSISDATQRDALRVLVASTPGVKRVEDHLTWEGEAVSVT